MRVWPVLVMCAAGAASCTPCPSCPRPTDPAAAALPCATAEPAAPGPAPQGMVMVPAGSFKRGSPEGVGLEDEVPQRDIHLDAFYLDRTEVRVKDYRACVEAGACRAPACTKDSHEVETRDEHPVACVAWAQARDYCAWADKRLPTEAEWEKAARGTDGRRYPWGDDEPTCERANSADCSGEGRRGTRPVGELPDGASPYGALDMAGNVWEWVEDWYHEDYFALSPADNPAGPWQGEHKIVRGGAFSYAASELVSHGRTYDEPGNAFDHVGFRCARSAR